MSDEIPPQEARAPGWLKDETEELIVLRGDMDHLFRKDDDYKIKQWHEVSDRLNYIFRNGRTAKECECKFLRLVRYYRDTGGKGPYSEQMAHVLSVISAETGELPALEDQEEELHAGQPEEQPPQQVINCALRILKMTHCLYGYHLEARSRLDPETQKLVLVPVIASGEAEAREGSRKMGGKRRRQARASQDVLVPTEAGTSGTRKGSRKMRGTKRKQARANLDVLVPAEAGASGTRKGSRKMGGTKRNQATANQENQDVLVRY